MPFTLIHVVYTIIMELTIKLKLFHCMLLLYQHILISTWDQLRLKLTLTL